MKYFNFFLLIIFIVSVGIFSCDKEDPTPSDSVFIGDSTKVEGRVLEYGTNIPVANAIVILREGVVIDFTGSPGFTNIDTLNTDASGYYKFYFKHRESPSNSNFTFLYEIRVYANQYFLTESGVQHGWWNKNLNLILDPFAWIKVHIKNVNPYDNNDRIFTASDGGGGVYLGNNVDTIEIHRNRGNRKKEIVWNVTKNKIKIEHSDSLYLIAHDTLFYEILY